MASIDLDLRLPSDGQVRILGGHWGLGEPGERVALAGWWTRGIKQDNHRFLRQYVQTQKKTMNYLALRPGFTKMNEIAASLCSYFD